MNPISTLGPNVPAKVTEADLKKSVADKAAAERAAKDFEAILLRQMLSSMQKTSKTGGGGKGGENSSVYSSMVVDAMADAINKGGGLGLAKTILEAQAKVSETATVRPHTEGIKPSAR